MPLLHAKPSKPPHLNWRCHRVNSSVRPGRTIVVGTDAGLYCRVQTLAEARLIFSSVDEHGERLGEHDLDLSQPRQLLECGTTFMLSNMSRCNPVLCSASTSSAVETMILMNS